MLRVAPPPGAERQLAAHHIGSRDGLRQTLGDSGSCGRELLEEVPDDCVNVAAHDGIRVRLNVLASPALVHAHLL
jgi:hypothetical protein